MAGARGLTCAPGSDVVVAADVMSLSMCAHPRFLLHD